MKKHEKKIYKKCEICGNDFECIFSKKNQKFCSLECYGQYRSKNKISYWKGKKRNIETINKMSKSHKREKAYNWKGGKIKDKHGYLLVLLPNHPNCNPLGYIREHRIIYEKYIGRYLERDEVIHHINGIKDDNRIENLRLYSCQSEHLSNGHKIISL